MAKRKRLSAPNPAFAADLPPEARPGPLSAPPIAGVAADAATSAALDEVTAELTAARAGGRMIVELPLEVIETDYLVRDRIAAEDEAMQALLCSLESRGQQVPVEVTELGAGRYGLISGWRRCQALTRLNKPTVKALIRPPQEASEAYLAMVEENEIRVGLSYYERARIVVKSAAQGVFADERAALSALFQAGSRARRSKIGTFVHIVHALDGALRFPAALSERAGLGLGRALQEDPALGARIVAALQKAKPETAEQELACLQAATAKTDTNKAQKEKKREDVVFQPRPGLTFRAHADGSVTLSGQTLDTVLRARLLEWLKASG